MKRLAAAVCIMWMAIAAEMAWAGQLTHGSLVIPFVCGVLYWTRSASGLTFSGLVLLLDWIARPTPFPLCPMLVPVIGALALAPSIQSQDRSAANRRLRIPPPFHLPLLTLVAVLLQVTSDLPLWNLFTTPLPTGVIIEPLKSISLIALPVSAGLSLLIRLADELGLRPSVIS